MIQRNPLFNLYMTFCFCICSYVISFFRPGLLPEHLDYLSAALAFTVQGVLFSWHLHGREMIDIQVLGGQKSCWPGQHLLKLVVRVAATRPGLFGIKSNEYIKNE